MIDRQFGGKTDGNIKFYPGSVHPLRAVCRKMSLWSTVDLR